MLTVFRILTSGTSSDLGDVVSALDTEDDVVLMQRGRGYVLDLSRATAWEDHSDAILRLIRENPEALSRAASEGASLIVDVAIEPEDRTNKLWLTVPLPPELLAALAEVAIELQVTIYPGEPDYLTDPDL